MVSFILPGNSATGGFDVANSLRFNSGSSDYLSRTPSSSSADGRRKFTISAWVKRANISVSDKAIFSGGSDANVSGFYTIKFDDNDKLRVQYYDDATYNIRTNRVFRDVSAWMHIVVANDTTQGTASNRTKIYINGVQETDVVNASGSTADYPNTNFDYNVNNDSVQQVGANRNSSASVVNYFDGYIAEFCMIDNQALDPTSFGEFDEDSGIWKPINVSGLTFGNNGFYLDFEDSSALGNDKAGSNNFTVNNLTAIDQSTDTCTNNFCTLNPLTKSSATFSEGNLKQGGAGASAVATFGVSSGKWYFEQKILGGNNEAHLGFALENSGIFKDNVTGGTVRGSGYVSLYSFDGKIYNEGSATSSFGTFSANDIIGFALDVDAGDIFLYQNGTVLNSGSAVVSGKTGKTWFPFGNFDSGNVTGIEHNFGGTQTFTISSGNSDGNGYGNFEYSVPSGYYALNSKNLAEYG